MAIANIPKATLRKMLAQIVNRIVKRGGSIVIPSFAMDDADVYVLLASTGGPAADTASAGICGQPDALSATDLYLKHKEDHDLEYVREEGSDGKGDPLNVHEFHLTGRWRNPKRSITSRPLHHHFGERMVSGGRVLHHLVQRLPDARNAVILAGFQAEGTRGRALQEGVKSLIFMGSLCPWQRRS